MKALWVFIYGWAAGIAVVIVLILYGFDFLVWVMRLVARLFSATGSAGSHSYTALYANSFFKGLNPDGTASHPDKESGGSSSDSDDNNEGADGTQKKSKKKKKHSHDKSSDKHLYGNVSYDHTKSLREQGLEGMTGRTSTVQPMKLTTTCMLSWFDESDKSFGRAVECRLLLTGRTITVYQLLLTGANMPGAVAGGGGGGAHGGKSGSGKGARDYADGARDDPDAGVSRAEHRKGSIHTGYITSKELKKFNKENKEASALTPFTGRVLVISSTDGLALLAPREELQSDLASTDGGSRASFDAAAPSPSLAHAATASGSVPGASQGSTDPTDDNTATATEGHAHHAAHAKKKAARRTARGPMATWSSVIIKFRHTRDCERWQNLLSGLADAEAWRQFAKSMPNPDTLNTFISRFFFQNMRSPNGIDEAIKKLIRKQLVKVSHKKFPRDIQGELMLDDFIIGTSIPWVSDVSDPSVSTNGEVGFDFNLLYKGLDGGLELFFRFALQYRGIRVPHMWFSAKLLELEATVHVSIGPPPSKKFWIGGHKPPVLRAEVHQGCASGCGILHRILTSLPDLSDIFTNLIKMYLFSDMILPVMDDFPLPNLSKAPKLAPREVKSNTFDRKRAAQHSAAPALAGAFTRQQLLEVERLLEVNNNDDTNDKSINNDAAMDGADPLWHPLSEHDPENGLTSPPFLTPADAERDAPRMRSAVKRATPPPPALSSPSPAATGALPSPGAGGSGTTKKVSFPEERPLPGVDLRADESVANSSGGGSAGVSSPTAVMRASTHSSREVLLANASGTGAALDSPLTGSNSATRFDASTRSAGANADGDDGANQKLSKVNASRSVRSLLKFKGDEMSKASVVRRKVKKEKEEEGGVTQSKKK